VNMLMRGVSVKETAFNLGYKDQFFFSKQFHQKLGYPPSAINPLNPRGAKRYQAKENATETESGKVPVTPPAETGKPVVRAVQEAVAPKTKKTASGTKKAVSTAGRGK